MTTCACANCDWVGTADQAEPCHDFWSRVAPGDTVPAGDCPDCGAFVFLNAGPLVIVSLSEPWDFWSNANGWGDLESATRFTQHERDTLRLPPGGAWTIYQPWAAAYAQLQNATPDPCPAVRSEVIDRASLDEDAAAAFDKPWIHDADDGQTQHDTEAEACDAQVIWRQAHGLDPMTGEAPQ